MWDGMCALPLAVLSCPLVGVFGRPFRSNAMPKTRAKKALTDPTNATTPEVKEIRIDPATVLTPELVALILEHLAKSTHYDAGGYHSQLNGGRNTILELGWSSRAWSNAVNEFVNKGAADARVSAEQLRAIKSAARGLKLDFLRPEFLKVADRQLGEFDMEEFAGYGPVDSEPHVGKVLNGILWAFKKQFCDDGEETKSDVALKLLSRSVEDAYRKFLVVKAVETHARAAGLAPNAWTEKSMASNLIDVFWHCHLLHPQHYLDSSSALLGAVGVIDHDPGYVSSKKIEGSELTSKINKLYGRELGGPTATFSGKVDYMHCEQARRRPVSCPHSPTHTLASLAVTALRALVHRPAGVRAFQG